MNSPIMFGEWLRQRRDELGHTRKEFAQRVGCSVSTLRKIEDSERRPSVQIAELMANCLDISPAEHSTFVKVARGELSVDRLSPVSKLVRDPNISPAPTSLATPRVNLPVIPTPLIGRQREIEELIRLLHDPQCHLLTLVGPGGIGKTRLAIEVASYVQESFADGVYLVPFASVNTTQLIVPMIADAVGFAFQNATSADPKTQLFNYLNQKKTLLLIDNLEHLLIEPGVEVLDELLANAPQVKFLTTSRETLGLQGEWIFEVHGLPVPENPQAEGSAQDTAIELFMQRARRAHIEFNATSDDLSAILRICRLVDGMPLAIELAAAWVRTLTCDEIAKEIERGLDFLKVSTRNISPRHRSMRAVFEHSWKLLTEEEKFVLVRLSVFRGGFRREAAEHVAGATLSILNMLVTKSLIRRNTAGRYDLHELIRQFAADQCVECQEEQNAYQARHSAFFLTYFGQADVRLRSSTQRETLAELTVEMDNIRAAWDWAVAHREFALIEQSLRTFIMFYDTRCWYQEGYETLGRAVHALEAAYGQSQPDRMEQVALGHLLTTRSLLTYRLGKLEDARQMQERSLNLQRSLNDLVNMVETLAFLSTVMSLTGNYARAMELCIEGREKSLAVGDQWFAAMCLSLHGNIAILTGKHKLAHELLQTAVTEWRLIGDPRFTAFGLNYLGQIALILERYDQAHSAFEESVALNSSVGARGNLGAAYEGLGSVAQAQGEYEQAVEMYRESVATFTELGLRFYVGQGLVEMGQSFFALGNDNDAERVWREALRVATEIHGNPVALSALIGLASLLAKRGDTGHALEMAMMILRHPAASHDTRNRAINLHAKLEAQLTQSQIASIQVNASKETLEAVVEKLLK